MGEATTLLTISIPEAAKRLGAPKAVVQRVAEQNGLLICFGNRKRIATDKITEILQLCQEKPKGPISINVRTQDSTSFEKAANQSVQRAQEMLDKLKQS